jgi:CDP-2,3-bis-(O-geranylgeranyl)-sn-glycerol synthase
MVLSLEQIVQLIVFILPAYVANAAPIIFNTGASKMPIDFKMKFIDNKRLLGGGKTWPGFFVGIISGTGVNAIIAMIFPLYPKFYDHVMIGLLLSLGTMIGDTIGSFLKRRLGVKHGKPVFLLDQLSFFIVAVAFVYPLKTQFLEFLDLPGFIFLLILTLILHPASNILAYKLGMKKVPW